MSAPKGELTAETRCARAQERIATALEQLVLIAASAPTTSPVTRLRSGLLRAETPGQVVSLLRRARPSLNAKDRQEAFGHAVARIVQVAGADPGLATEAQADAWLAEQFKPGAEPAPKAAPKSTAKAGQGRGR